jgi:membrane protein
MMDDETPITRAPLLTRLSAIIRGPVARTMRQWPGRVALGSAAGMARVEIFDRAMTIAAQFFTSVFPIIIMAASWLGADEVQQVAQWLGMPPKARVLLIESLGRTRVDTFGLVGALVVLVSATSLSRALTRAFCAVWRLPRAPRRLLDTWRWLAVILMLALSMVVTRLAVALVHGLSPQHLWSTAVYLVLHTVLAVSVPWLLMAGRIPARHLAPGAIIFALMMLVVRPTSTLYLSYSLESSADRYGPIGVAFTYLTWLYVISFTMLLSAVIGQVVASDDGPIGRFIRRPPGTNTTRTG